MTTSPTWTAGAAEAVSPPGTDTGTSVVHDVTRKLATHTSATKRCHLLLFNETSLKGGGYAAPPGITSKRRVAERGCVRRSERNARRVAVACCVNATRSDYPRSNSL